LGGDILPPVINWHFIEIGDWRLATGQSPITNLQSLFRRM
jgi:hypothetical protein